MKTALVCGAGGFIGSHLVKRLKADGYWVRGVDLKYPEFSKSEADEFIIGDLRRMDIVKSVLHLDLYLTYTYYNAPFRERIKFAEVYQLAADMGGAGYVFTGEHDADIMHNSAQINLNICEAIKGDSTKVFYSSSACMYPQEIQNDLNPEYFYDSTIEGHNLRRSEGLREFDAYPANPDSEYGWEKLFSERLYLAYARNYGLNVRIARFHNIYGPEGTYKGGKEKAPAAMCRKVIESCNKRIEVHYAPIDESGTMHKMPGEVILPPSYQIEVWGNGQQTRSFLYIDDCIDAVRLLMESDFKEPINIGSEEMISINDLAKMAIDISGKSIKIKNIDGPTGVRGRNSNNDLIRKILNWEPKFSLRQGMEITYNWINSQYGL